MIRAFLFDLDGTLLDTETLWVRALRAWLLENGVPCTDAEAVALVYGHSWRDIYAEIVRRHPHLGIGEQAAGEATRPHFRRLRDRTDVRIPGSVALLRRLAATYPVAIVSGSPRADVADGIGLLGIGPLLRFYLGAEDYPRGKPDPSGFLLAAERLGEAPAGCVVFEDSAAGVRAAKAAGMRCVALARPDAHRQDLAGADLVLADLEAFDPHALRGTGRHHP
jgi:HAD superfamily hydrolase (TIGR01509 family)